MLIKVLELPWNFFGNYTKILGISLEFCWNFIENQLFMHLPTLKKRRIFASLF